MPDRYILTVKQPPTTETQPMPDENELIAPPEDAEPAANPGPPVEKKNNTVLYGAIGVFVLLIAIAVIA